MLSLVMLTKKAIEHVQQPESLLHEAPHLSLRRRIPYLNLCKNKAPRIVVIEKPAQG
jgi:hypothetical protein